MSNIIYLSPDQAKRAIYLNWTATLIAGKMGLTLKVPTALVGDTGCGKTDAVRAFAKQLQDAASKNNTTSHLWTVPMYCRKTLVAMQPRMMPKASWFII